MDWKSQILAVTVISGMAGCSVGGVDVWSGDTAKIDAGGYRFKVIYNDQRAEAYRQGLQFRPDAREVFAAARIAMERASGCRVVISSIRGDVALVEADLLCGFGS